MATGDDLLTAADYLLGIPGEVRLSQDSWLSTSLSGEIGGAAVNSPALVSAANTASWESDQAESSWTLREKDDDQSADDSTLDTEIWDRLAVDATFAGWTSRE
jgi:hypothetical protein